MSVQTARNRHDLPDAHMRIDPGGLGQASDYAQTGVPPMPPALYVDGCVEAIREIACEFLAVAERIAVALERLRSDYASTRTGDGSSGAADYCRSDAERRSVDSEDSARPDSLNAQVRLDRLAVLEAQQLEVRELLLGIRELVKAPSVPHEKKLYTVAEVEKCTPYKQWTIRRACTKGRITAQKSADGQWRVPHEQVVKIQNEGLPPE